MNKISIFMNIFNVHVNRIPVSGRVVWLKYVPGAFFNASLDKSSEKNERMIAKIEIKKDLYIYVVQIAGLIARRIKCELEENQNVKVGERFGIIRFGSRVDLYLPKTFNISVLEDQTMISGETIVADIESSISKIQKINKDNEKIITKKFNTEFVHFYILNFWIVCNKICDR